jgi:hypothetical protein
MMSSGYLGFKSTYMPPANLVRSARLLLNFVMLHDFHLQWLAEIVVQYNLIYKISYQSYTSYHKIARTLT